MQKRRKIPLLKEELVNLSVPSHALQVAMLPWHHRDPFDRLLIAQSQVERLPILSANRQLAAYDVQVQSAE